MYNKLIIHKVMTKSTLRFEDLTAVAVTSGPGLGLLPSSRHQKGKGDLCHVQSSLNWCEPYGGISLYILSAYL